ncbi:hypothetical protein [Tetragenococcus solitarius]|uniref:Uncharacterized protein n=1 Tax=Tetragenococcus solitarius TaxID=71453 RepID=A0ABP6KSI1_9ENTE|nr:hypothetical protein [Tetragenococcus solitarius]
MKDIDQIKRKHSRFPVFSDETGVKIRSERKHPPFSDDEPWILTEASSTPLTKSVLKENKKKRGLRRTKKDTLEKAGLTIQEQNELKKHRKHLPSYSSKNISTYQRTSVKQNQSVDSLKRKRDRQSYFASKYVPATASVNKKMHKNSDKELLHSLEKSQDDYLLFETDHSHFQPKNVLRQFNQNEAVDNQQTKEKNSNILNRSLKGMIEEDQNDLKGNGYFKEG